MELDQSSLLAMIEATTSRLLEQADLAAARAESTRGDFPASLWQVVAEAGLPVLLCPAEQGGIGAGFVEAVGVARIFGENCAPAPIVETLIGNWLKALAGMEVGAEPIALLIDYTHRASAARVGLHVPWAGHADLLVVDMTDATCRVGVLPCAAVPFAERSANLAGEPRATIELSRLPLSDVVWRALPDNIDATAIAAKAALLRAAQIVGALDRALGMSLTYTAQRNQFGRPLAQFQVIQHVLANMATQIAAARVSVEAAARQDDAGRAVFMAAVAKARASEAAGIVAAGTHQVHGAMGFTQEYGLSLATRRLLAWRDEFGSERYWQEWLGERAQSGDLWPLIAA